MTTDAHRRSAITRRARSPAALRRVSLCETLDRVLNKGAVIAGDLVISVADIDLVYVGLNVIVASVETMRRWEAPLSKIDLRAGAGVATTARIT